jgi:GNAT superfamily N-acetyltransferase
MPIQLRQATPDDAEAIVELINDLADYEDLSHEVAADPRLLAAHLRPDANPGCEAILAEDGKGRPAGFALFYSDYSTFLTDWGIYLEDLFVREEYRGIGIGHALLSWLAAEAVRRGAVRLNWQVLDWNDLAIDFYTRMGARSLGEWQPMRLEGEALASFAGTAAAAMARLRAHSGTI